MMKKIVSDIPLAQHIIQSCKQQHIQNIIISPGSRNAPLTISFTNDPYFKCYSIVDERCAAFFAMGIAQQLKKPTAIVCTSGSALLNYYPAISEAFYSDIPLVVISADRPKDRIDIGDGQTIRQEGVFKNHILFEANLLNPEKIDYSSVKDENETLIHQALNSAKSDLGPVHINVPFNEPLYNTIEEVVNIKESAIQFNENKKASFQLSLQDQEIWNKANKILILAGVLSPNSMDEQLLDQLLSDPRVLFLTETTSNLYHEKIIPNIDQLILKLPEESQKDLQPDLLISIGGMVVSKKIKAFLRNFSPKTHWHIDPKKAYDTYFCLTKHFKLSVSSFFTGLKYDKLTTSDYQDYWLHQHQIKKENFQNYLHSAPYSDLKVFESVLRYLPQNTHLQLSNSSTIRYTQLFKILNGTDVYCNRGTSGIDGSTSTAIGASLYNEKPTVLITGDLSFLYDSNALWNNYIPSNFKIIIINNSGGGIFRILPGNKNAAYYSEFLETNHNLTAEHLSKMYGFNYETISSLNECENKLVNFYESEEKSVIEIFTPSTINDTVLLNSFS